MLVRCIIAFSAVPNVISVALMYANPKLQSGPPCNLTYSTNGIRLGYNKPNKAFSRDAFNRETRERQGRN